MKSKTFLLIIHSPLVQPSTSLKGNFDLKDKKKKEGADSLELSSLLLSVFFCLQSYSVAVLLPVQEAERTCPDSSIRGEDEA